MVVHNRAIYRKLYRATLEQRVCLPEADKTGPFLFILIQCMASLTPSSNCLSNVSEIESGDYVC